MKRTISWRVFIYKPCGARLKILPVEAMTAEIAIKKAKDAVYKMGRLAHFYKYFPVEETHAESHT